MKTKINLKRLDLDQTHKYGWTYLMNALEHSYSLTPQQWTYLIEYSPLDAESTEGWTALSHAMKNQNINNVLNVEQLTYLIYNSPKHATHDYGGNALSYALRNKNLQLPQELYQELVSKTDLYTFPNLHEEYYRTHPFVIACLYKPQISNDIFMQLMIPALYHRTTWDNDNNSDYLKIIIDKVWELTSDEEKLDLIDYFNEENLTHAAQSHAVISFLEKYYLESHIAAQIAAPKAVKI